MGNAHAIEQGLIDHVLKNSTNAGCLDQESSGWSSNFNDYNPHTSNKKEEEETNAKNKLRDITKLEKKMQKLYDDLNNETSSKQVNRASMARMQPDKNRVPMARMQPDKNRVPTIYTVGDIGSKSEKYSLTGEEILVDGATGLQIDSLDGYWGAVKAPHANEVVAHKKTDSSHTGSNGKIPIFTLGGLGEPCEVYAYCKGDKVVSALSGKQLPVSSLQKDTPRDVGDGVFHGGILVCNPETGKKHINIHRMSPITHYSFFAFDDPNVISGVEL